MTHRILAGLVIALTLAVSSTKAAPRYLLEPLDSPAPSSPDMCFDVSEPGSKASVTWMVFSAPGCDPCHRWLERLSKSRKKLADAGIAVRHYVTAVDNCLGAARSAGHHRGAFPLGIAGARAEARWAVDSTPTTYIVRDARVVGRLVGVAPVEEVIALSKSQ